MVPHYVREERAATRSLRSSPRSPGPVNPPRARSGQQQGGREEHAQLMPLRPPGDGERELRPLAAGQPLTPGWHLGPGMLVAMRVLVAEDHEVLATAIAAGLRREGMAVDLALHGHDALDRLSGTRYDVVVLDRDLPGVHWDEVCRVIVAGDSGSRVLMLPAAWAVSDKVDGHGLGLAIVSAVAAAHGAGLAVRARPEGGLDVTVTFP
jgi:CheY-like chemotaxis protein